MKKFSERIAWSKPSSIERVAGALKKDELVVGTSDTILGFLATTTLKAKKLLDETKGRQDKPYLVLIASIDNARQLVAGEDLARVASLTAACWPGPLTIIFRAKPGMPSYMLSQAGTIALRMPQHAGLQKLLTLTGPLFSTSANKAGEPVPTTFEALDPSIVAQAAYLVSEDNESVAEAVTPSTIVDCSGQEPVVVREGVYSREQLQCYISV